MLGPRMTDTPSSEDVPETVAKARAAQPAWAALSTDERAEVGKPEVEALLGEVLPSADVVQYWTSNIADLLDPEEVDIDAIAYPGKEGTIEREARGVVAVIMPWNFPFALPLRTIVPALLAGNAVVFKPSEVSPKSGALVAEVLAGLVPDGLFGLVQGSGEVGAALCEAEVDLVVFTGSVATGRKVAHACAERLVPSSLELGGKDAAIVLADANLERAAQGIVWGAMMNAGQNCAAIERVYVEKAVAEKFSKRVAEITKALRFGADVGPLATEAQRALVASHVEGAKTSSGTKILAGGNKLEEGYGFEPTVMHVETDDTP